MQKDPIVEEIRKIREEHSAKYNHDLRAIYKDLKEQEYTSGRRYVKFPAKRIAIKKVG